VTLAPGGNADDVQECLGAVRNDLHPPCTRRCVKIVANKRRSLEASKGKTFPDSYAAAEARGLAATL